MVYMHRHPSLHSRRACCCCIWSNLHHGRQRHKFESKTAYVLLTLGKIWARLTRWASMAVASLFHVCICYSFNIGKTFFIVHLTTLITTPYCSRKVPFWSVHLLILLCCALPWVSGNKLALVKCTPERPTRWWEVQSADANANQLFACTGLGLWWVSREWQGCYTVELRLNCKIYEQTQRERVNKTCNQQCVAFHLMTRKQPSGETAFLVKL